MPRKPIKSKRRRSEVEVPKWAVNFLFIGKEPTETTWESYRMKYETELQREAWEQIRADVVPAWIRQHPGQRPYGWWAFDSPEPRKKIGGKGLSFEQRTQPKHVRYFFGIPAGPFMQLDASDPLMYESEPAFLKRHNLLTPTEIKKLENIPGVFDPVEVGNRKTPSENSPGVAGEPA